MGCFCIGGPNCCIRRTNYCANCGAIWSPYHQCQQGAWSGHCCVCQSANSFCLHVGGPWYCPAHQPWTYPNPNRFWWTDQTITTKDNTTPDLHA